MSNLIFTLLNCLYSGVKSNVDFENEACISTTMINLF